MWQRGQEWDGEVAKGTRVECRNGKGDKGGMEKWQMGTRVGWRRGKRNKNGMEKGQKEQEWDGEMAKVARVVSEAGQDGMGK